jgi:hypothetical protein
VGRPRTAGPAVHLAHCKRRVLAFVRRAGRPVAWSELRVNVGGCSLAELRHALAELTSDGSLQHSTRREPFLPRAASREIEREYWDLADRIHAKPQSADPFLEGA